MSRSSTDSASFSGSASAPTYTSSYTDDQKIQSLLTKKDFSKAEPLIRERLRLNPQDSDGHYFLGVYFYMQGQIVKTVDHLKKALQLDPRHTDAAICLSVLYNDIGRYDDAKKVFEQANQSVAHRKGESAEVDRKFSVKHLELADLYFRYRRYDEACEEYLTAVALDPTHHDIRIRLAKSYAKKGFLSRAIQELQQLKKEQGQFAPARIQLGLLHYSQGNVLDAELEWESVLQIEPQNREAIAYLEMAKTAYHSI